MSKTKWTAQEIQQLTKLYKVEKLSYEKIAERLGRNRNQVAGKLFNLGLNHKITPYILTKKAERVNPNAIQNKKKFRKKEIEFHEKELSLGDLKRTQCLFPISPNEAKSHRFCGEIRVEGSSYCCKHKEICRRKIFD